MPEEPEIIKYLNEKTYTSPLLEIKTQRILFIMYHIMRLRDGDKVPSAEVLTAFGKEHGIMNMSLAKMKKYEEWLKIKL
jgi:hypothetical protein